MLYITVAQWVSEIQWFISYIHHHCYPLWKKFEPRWFVKREKPLISLGIYMIPWWSRLWAGWIDVREGRTKESNFHSTNLFLILMCGKDTDPLCHICLHLASISKKYLTKQIMMWPECVPLSYQCSTSCKLCIMNFNENLFSAIGHNRRKQLNSTSITSLLIPIRTRRETAWKGLASVYLMGK